ncbi:hypothetical protein [Sphingopyxis panaciterrulae]|uniref:Uncharacterized protein n=1 Tax=Sphingopyxis panaciterrulae TaxID=462372 RepID=A0A7W9B6B6_9SPHN|nr:hypothetical protein [Sphingopyxis panaciterrulae]MBB5707079.1 hypothetical protein [Sphingopyxis panaciterrulae]
MRQYRREELERRALVGIADRLADKIEGGLYQPSMKARVAEPGCARVCGNDKVMRRRIS